MEGYRPITTFINLSGGVDSTYYLWRWLREHPNERILVHHCLFLERRVKEEKDACVAILAYLKGRGLGNFKYVETGLQKGTLKGRLMDIEFLVANTAMAVKMYPSVANILLSYSREETEELSNHFRSGGQMATFDSNHRYWVVNRVLELLTGRGFNYRFYLEEDKGLYSKVRMIKEMPKELFGLTWWCRRPIRGKPCRACHTCKSVSRALK